MYKIMTSFPIQKNVLERKETPPLFGLGVGSLVSEHNYRVVR